MTLQGIRVQKKTKLQKLKLILDLRTNKIIKEDIERSAFWYTFPRIILSLKRITAPFLQVRYNIHYYSARL